MIIRPLLSRLQACCWNLLTNPSQATVFLTILLAAKVAISIALYTDGFGGVSADEYSRSISEMIWADNPYIVLGMVSWLPFHLYLNGSLLLVVADPLWVPRVTAFIASFILLFYFFKLVRNIFSSYFVAATSSIGLVVYHWYVGLSATPMLDIYYLAAFVAGLYYAEKWVADFDKPALYIGATCFFLATGFHYQAWVLVGLIDLGSLFLIVRLTRRREWRLVGHQFCAYLIMHAYIFFTMVTTFLDVGNPLAFLGTHTEYSKWFYDGYSVSWVSKSLYYPRMLLTNANPLFGILSIIGVFFALATSQDRPRYLVPLIAGLFVLATYSIFNVFSVPPTAAPDRFSLVFYLFLLPYAGLAILRIAPPHSDSVASRSNSNPASIAIPLLFVGILWAGFQLTNLLPLQRNFSDAAKAGHEIAELLRQEPPGAGYLLELNYWEYLPAKLTAGNYNSQYFDRVKDVRKRNLPSLLLENPEAFSNMLNQRQIVVMAFRTRKLIRLAKRYGELVSNHGAWHVFKVHKRKPMTDLS